MRNIALISVIIGLLYSTQPTYADNEQSAQQIPPIDKTEADFSAYLLALEQQAEQGNAQAAKDLAIHYEVNGNLPQAGLWIARYVELTEALATRGDVNAMLDLGKLFYGGTRFYPKNYEQARRWFTLAAEQGNAIAGYQTGLMYKQGQGGEQNESKATEYFSRALQAWQKQAEQGDSTAALWIGLLYERQLLNSASPEQSEPFFIQAAQGGNIMAQIILALKYRDGTGVPRNISKAIEYFELAARQNDLGAIMELGIIYRDGKQVPVDKNKAMNWFQQGVQLHDPYSQTALADMLIQPDMTTEQHTQALELYLQAAQAGYAPAAIMAAELLHTGKAGKIDIKQAITLLQQTVNTTADPQAMFLLGQIYGEQDQKEQSISLIRAAAQAAYIPAINRMAQLHLIPGSGVDWNPRIAYYYWQQSAALGDEQASSNALWLVITGILVIVLIVSLFVWRIHKILKRRLVAQANEAS